MWLSQSLRLLRHELRRGELTIICLAIVLAVATVFSLTGFSSQIQQALESKSSSFIAADSVLQTSRPIAAEVTDFANEQQLQQTQQLIFGSMVFSGDKMKLADVKAVSSGYPLRGELLIQDTHTSIASPRNEPPNTGNVWVSPKLLSILNLSVGDELELGAAMFVIKGIIEQEPDASFNVFASNPKIIMNIDDVPSTEIIKPGSRLTYRYLFAGEEDALEAFEEFIKPQLVDGQRWYDIKSQQSPLSNALNRAEKYLSLASLLGIILAATAVATATRRYGQRHQPTVAVFKAMGASKSYITKLYLVHWFCLSLFSIVIGLIVGFTLQQIGLNAMQQYLPDTSYTINLYPLSAAVATGLLCAVAFAVAPLRQLVNTSPLSVIRGFKLSYGKLKVLEYLPATLGMYSLLWMFSDSLYLATVLFLGSLAVVVILLLAGRIFIVAGRTVGTKAGKSLHLALANLKRRANENSVQLVSFTIAIQLLLLLVVVRNDLIAEWQDQLPDNAPNHFLVNISPEQIEPINAFMKAQQLEASALYPIVRGRLSAINQEHIAKPVSKDEDKESDQGRRGVGRELNLTWREAIPNQNEIVEGEWWPVNSEDSFVSVEESLAKRLDIKLNDELKFLLGSQEIVVKVSSIRKVDWQSMQPNFYMIFNPSVLSDFPMTYISSVNVPAAQEHDLLQFLIQYPTIIDIDVNAMIDQLRSVIGQVSIAIEWILALVVLAGSLVLVAQVQASMEERERELAILRTLGAKGSLLRNSVLFEFVALGLIAGTLASITMEIAVYILQSKVFDMSVNLHPEAWGYGIVSGGVFVGLMGLISCWRLLNMSSVTLIRRTL